VVLFLDCSWLPAIIIIFFPPYCFQICQAKRLTPMNEFDTAFCWDMHPTFKEVGVRRCLAKATQYVEERNWPAFLDQCARAISISPSFFGICFDRGPMSQFISEYEVDPRETDVAFEILMLGLIINDGKDWSWNMIDPTQQGLSCIISLIRKLRADSLDSFVEYPLLKIWKLYLYYGMLLKDVGNYALAKRSLEYALHFEPPMDWRLIVIDDIEKLEECGSYSCFECNKEVDEKVSPGDRPCGCIFKFCSVACKDESGHDSSYCNCEDLRTVVFYLEA
jgi:hypothetical protein